MLSPSGLYEYEEVGDPYDLNGELDFPETFGPHGRLDYNAAQAIWQATMNAHADNRCHPWVLQQQV